jgi:PAS domain S-box-containing protein
MSATDVQVRFAAEFALFLVSLAGLGFAFLRSDLLVSRPIARVASALGFACLASAALVSGSLIVSDPSSPAVVALRVAGIALLATASLSWYPGGAGRELLRIGLVALIVAEVVVWGDQTSTLADAARGIGALGIGACLLGASSRVISARIAASGALVIFAAITAMAVALSAVVSNNIEKEALQRYGARAQTEAATIGDSSKSLLPSAKVLATALGSTVDTTVAQALRRVTDPAKSPGPADTALVADQINRLVAAFVTDEDPFRGPTLVVDHSGRVVVVTPPEGDTSFLVALAGLPVVSEAVNGQTAAQAIVDIGGRALAVASQPLSLLSGENRGVLVRTSEIDSQAYLQALATPIANEESGVALALVDRDRVLSDNGTKVKAADVRRLAVDALDAGGALERTVGDRFLAARPIVSGSGGPELALVLSAPRAQEDATRQDLFRVLFLIAMGAATAALALAALTGERIGAGLRRLTDAAAGIQAGNLDARAQIDTDDELGALGRSFNAMAASLHSVTADLRNAALGEAELRGRLEAVVGGMGEALVAVDSGGEVTDFNAAAEELFDLTAQEARGRPIGEVVRMRSADGTDLTRRLRRPVLEGWADLGTIRLADGREVPVAISAGTLRGPGNDVVGAVFVLRDERREAELERMKTEFLANISHELRTPLTPIKGFASILQTRDLPPAKAHGFAEEISVAADQLERVIGQLVNFATIVGGRLSIDPHPVPVRALVERTLKPWRARAGDTHKLVRRVASGIPDVVADSTYLAQALDELLDNAVKYSPDGGRIVVGADVAKGEDGPELHISVSDSGVGIAADRLDSVLQDFTQGDASSTRRFGGLGLGLALVNRIANAHGGHLRVDSAPDEGTTVTMVLPVRGPGGGSSR